MVNKIYRIIFFCLLPALFGACNDDLELNDHVPQYIDGELVVNFDISKQGMPGTRTTINDYGTEMFSNGDMIHIVGTFNIRYLEEGATGDEYKTGTVSRYGALRYNGNGWEPVEGSGLTWPAVATDGQFTAYFINGNSSILTGSESSGIYPLSNLTPGTDPLTAVSVENIPYGHAVELNFTHICAFLTLDDMIPMVADEYWFTTDGPVNKETGETEQLNNAFRISLQDGTYGPELNFEFLQSPNPSYTPSVYIASQKQASSDESGEGTGTTPARVSYFLEPGFYPKFKIVYPSTETAVYDYLEYDFYNIQQDVGDTEYTLNEPDLKANTPYMLSITKAPGVTVILPPSGDEWDESENYFDVDVEAFLKAVYNKEGYSENNVQILEQTATGTLLLHNVNFNNFDYAKFKDQNFRPNNIQGSVFDGGYHYIRNLGSPLLRYNFGTVQNLGVKNAAITFTTYEIDNSALTETDDMSRVGAFCMWNRSNATISNIRVSDVTMNVNVRTVDRGGQETHNIGGIFGSNTGVINEVALSGNFNVTVQGENGNAVNASVLIGGIMGQNAGEGKISNISPISGTPTFTITNKCTGPLGSYSVGGVVGESQGYITDIILTNVTIDGSSSSGVTSYMGGVAGQLQVTSTSDDMVNALLNSCIVNGTVKAGESKPYNAITSVSYTGGISGTVLNVPIIDCRVAVDLYGPATAIDGVVYGMGGAIGRIRTGSTYDIQDIIAHGKVLKYPQGDNSYAGNFAGIVPEGQDDSDYANKNITVYVFTGVNFIGAALPDVLSN